MTETAQNTSAIGIETSGWARMQSIANLNYLAVLMTRRMERFLTCYNMEACFFYPMEERKGSGTSRLEKHRSTTIRTSLCLVCLLKA